jgi:AcrR family transcriptional regulator
MNTRAYRQRARAASTEATRVAILDACDAVFLPDPGRSFTLEEVAGRGGTTVQTVLRHFGSKSGLLAAAAQRNRTIIMAGRDQVPTGDLRGVAQYLGRHYEEVGDMVLGMLAFEAQGPDLASIAERGREMHRAWVERVLEPLIEPMPLADRPRRVAVLVAVTDLLTWKVLRKEQGLEQHEYEHSVHELLEALQ